MTAHCERIVDLLDTWLDRELPALEASDVEDHLDTCAPCRAEADARSAFRRRLRAAAQAQPVPAGLAARVFAAKRPVVYRNPGFMAIAAAAVLTIAVVGYQLNGLRNRMVSQDSYIADLSRETSSIIRVGLKDHVHCAVFRKFPDSPPTFEEMAAELGPEYKDLLPAMAAHVPTGMTVVMAHKCSYQGRQYIHLVARDGRNMISLVIAKRGEGEAFETPFYSTSVRQYSVAGFETPEHLVYLVSDMNQNQNLQLMQAMTARIRQVLTEPQG